MFVNPATGTTPLIHVARVGDADLIDFLLDRGADINHRNRMGKTALLTAADAGHADIVRQLKAAGAKGKGKDIDEALLYGAAKAGETKVVLAMLRRGVDPNNHNEFEQPAIVVAAKEGHADVVKVLIAAGADYTTLLPQLFFTYQGPSIEVVEMLIAEGADVNLSTEDGRSPLMLAARGGDLKILEMLLAAGANINQKDGNGHTAIDYAAGTTGEFRAGVTFGSPAALRALLEHSEYVEE
jgi:ankyrin repeat protein